MSHLPLDIKVVDPRLQAGRGEEFSASRQAQQDATAAADGFSLPMGQTQGYVDTEAYEAASTAQAIPQSNKGFQMLQKMGWKTDTGLGASGDGIVAPIEGGAEAGVRLGLGKQEEDDFYTSTENVQRKRLEVEVQADEDFARTLARESRAHDLEQIRADVTNIKRTFYCEVCRKQYNSAAELEIHLDSYDHHHRKRLVEMRSDDRERTKRDRDRKEKRRQDKEMARLNQQIQMASGKVTQPASSKRGEEAAPPLPPLPPPDDAAMEAPPLPIESMPTPDTRLEPVDQKAPLGVSLPSGGKSFQFGMTQPSKPSISKTAQNNVSRFGGGFGLGAKAGGIQKVGKLKSKVAAFSNDSDDE